MPEICTWNWELIYKFFQTTLAVALLFSAYFLWHRQKKKEIIASEAKDAVKDLLELLVVNRSIRYENSKSKSELELKLIKFKELSTKVHRSLLFLNRSKQNEKLNKHLEIFYIRKETTYHSINNVVNNSDVFIILDFLQSDFCTSEIWLLEECMESLVNIIHPYSLFKRI